MTERAELPHILIVEDISEIRQLIVTYLRAESYDISAVGNGQDALDLVRQTPIDLILLDIGLPDMSGFEVCRKLKADSATRAIPIIFLTGRREEDYVNRGFDLGGVDYITKPVNSQELLARVRTHVDLYRLQKDLEQQVAERTKKLEATNQAYSYFVPEALQERLNLGDITDVALGKHADKAEMSFLFADIRGFTEISDKMKNDPAQNFDFINSYLERVSPIIREHNGVIDKYLGDGIMAIFPENGNADNAVRAAIAMQREVAAYNTTSPHPIKIGIGVHTGEAILGIIGERERMGCTVISDAVNVASRLEELTKTYQAQIIISGESLNRLENSDSYRSRRLGQMQLRGRKKALSIYELLEGTDSDADIDQRLAKKYETKSVFEEGIAFYDNEKYPEAIVRFQSVLDQNPEDKAANLYLKRAAYEIAGGIKLEWEDIEVLYLGQIKPTRD